MKLLHGHADYEGVEPEVRKKLLFRFASLVKTLPIKYALFAHNPSEVGGKADLEPTLRRDISAFVFDNLAYLQRFDEIHVYYDGGYPNLKKISTTSGAARFICEDAMAKF